MEATNQSENITYHLGELELSKSPENLRSIIPEFKSKHLSILDMGCGIGQTFVATGANEDGARTLIGLDYDLEALSYGQRNYTHIYYINGECSNLPIKTESMDLVVSRVTLPYTNIPKAIKEIERVLKPGGELWITLHSAKVLLNPLLKSLKSISMKSIIVRSFYLMNGVLFHFFGVLLPNPKSGEYESFQTDRGIRRELRRNNFKKIKIKRGVHFLVTAVKPEI